MPYHLDLSALSLSDYQQILRRQNLLPGRRALWQNIDHNFDQMVRQGILNIAGLKERLATPQKLASLAVATGIPADYLILLKREIGSFLQKPVPLASFPELDPKIVSDLQARGVKTSKDYYQSGLSSTDELFCLCDLVRINGVGAVAARAFYEAGYRSAAAIAGADAALMLSRVAKVNDAKQYYKAKLGLKDMQFCIDFASLLIKYGG